MALVEIEGCIYEERLLQLARGFESLDPVGREAFVNHLHLDGDDRVAAANRIIQSWISEMRSGWPTRAFRIYRQLDEDEVTIRFHLIRPGMLNWCEEGVEIIPVNE